MKAINRTDVKPGQMFKMFPTADGWCLAVNSEAMNKRLKATYFGGAGKLWHVYIPTGDVTWMNPAPNVVYIEG